MRKKISTGIILGLFALNVIVYNENSESVMKNINSIASVAVVYAEGNGSMTVNCYDEMYGEGPLEKRTCDIASKCPKVLCYTYDEKGSCTIND